MWYIKRYHLRGVSAYVAPGPSFWLDKLILGTLFPYLQHLAANLHGFSKEHYIHIYQKQLTLSLRLACCDQWGGGGTRSCVRASNPILTISSSIYISSSFTNIISQASSLPTHQLHNLLTLRCSRLKWGCCATAHRYNETNEENSMSIAIKFKKKRKKIHEDKNKIKQITWHVHFQKSN